MEEIFKTSKNDIRVYNNIYQLTDAPDIVISGEGDKYIGYEHIGGAYSGNNKYLIRESDELFADYLAEVTGNGIFLDLACGDGCFTVPCARHGTQIIAGDISNAMMTILQERARRNDVSLENVTLCRMNALEIPLKDESVNCVVANQVLHLISNPQRVIREIYRVLKPGGRFVCKDDRPGKELPIGIEHAEENELCRQITNGIYSAYWSELNAQGVKATKYSWRFDRDEVCKNIFSSREIKIIERGNESFTRIVDKFLPRFIGRGFSDQVDVPPELHKTICDKVVAEYRQKYGETFDSIGHYGVEEDIVITSYVK